MVGYYAKSILNLTLDEGAKEDADVTFDLLNQTTATQYLLP
jgi:hypothetical protein